jgi:hypothetical protein
MNRNYILFHSAASLVGAARFIRHIDENFANELLDKAQEYKEKIEPDPQLEKEIEDYGKRIREGL